MNNENMRSEIMNLYDEAPKELLLQSRKIMSNMVEYKKLKMQFTCALKEIQTKFDVLNTEFNNQHQRNPISSISTRIKSTTSTFEKMAKLNIPLTLENIENEMHDIAGIRVVCEYLDDIYMLADALISQDDITLVEKRDYIANPKPSGYQSLHLIVSVPIFLATEKKDMKVEVQIRTKAMDFWASLEHQIHYKHTIGNEEEIAAKLKECADEIYATDKKMLDIRKEIEKHASEAGEDESLFEEIKMIDIEIQ